MKAFFVAVGSELVEFKINKYSPIFSGKLREIGIELLGEITTKDNIEEIIKSIDFATKNSDIIVISGGLGPTKDDITRQALSKYLKIPLVYSEMIDRFIRKNYGNPDEKDNLKNQCYVLKNAFLLKNMYGTAFGEIIEKSKKVYIILPGPFVEWKGMWKGVKNYLLERYNLRKTYFKRVKFADIKEVELENLVKDIFKKYELGYTILAGENICEIAFEVTNKVMLNKILEEVYEISGNYIYGEDDELIENVVAKLLKDKNKTVSTAESCTSGLLAAKLTDIPGSSKYFIGGVNSYSNEIKVKFLNVKKKMIENYGAVSEQVAFEMAKNVRKIFKTDFGLSITGIAGPYGGSKEKPVGLVYFGVSTPQKTVIEKRIFLNKERKFIRNASVNTSLFILLKMLKSN